MLPALLLLTAAPRAIAGPASAPPPPRDNDVNEESVVAGALKARLSTFPADLVVMYAAEHKGSVETCGCPHRPRGSLARLEAYADAATAGIASVRVHGGYWLEDAIGLDGAPRPDVAVMNRWMVDGLSTGEWDALNVTYHDIAGVASSAAQAGVGPDANTLAALPLVSANVTGPGIRRYVVVTRNGIRVGITGISAAGVTMSDAPGFTVAPPATAGPVLEELAAQSDVVILLEYAAADEAKALVKKFPAIDLVIDTEMHRESLDPVRMRSTVWTYANFETMRAGEMRLQLDRGQIRVALDRKIDLDPEVPDDPALLALQRRARTAIDAAQSKIYGP